MGWGPRLVKEREESLKCCVIWPSVIKETLTTTPFPHDELNILKV